MLRFINGRELCPEQACELNGVCKLARVKLSELHCMNPQAQVPEILDFKTWSYK